ncbi:MAG: hypothetical protein AB7G75_00625 [Candidatus Binatia bacterium]
MKLPIFFLLPLLFPFNLAHGETLREIELNDGSIIKAHVLSMDGTMYRLRSETLGEVEIPEYRVKTIRQLRTSSASQESQSPPIPTPPAQDGNTEDTSDTTSVAAGSLLSAPSVAAELQHSFSQDLNTMKMVLSLQDDPLVQDILGDAQLMQAIHSGNLGALMTDPRIQELIRHPIVQDLSDQYGQ